MSEAAPDGEQNPPTSPHTILVVDDDAALCRFICLLLTQYGYTALHALNADEMMLFQVLIAIGVAAII